MLEINNETPLVSIIIPVWNTEKYLSKCLDSILLQTYSNLEIILINDGSVDDSLKICLEYQKKDNRIIVINKENTGVSDTRNVGLKKSSGDYILFVDSDDYILEKHVEVLLNGILEYKADICIANYYIEEQFNNIHKYNKKNHSYVLSGKNAIRTILLREDFDGATISKLYSRDSIKNVIFDIKEKMWEDLFFALFAINNSKSVCFVKNKSYCYVYRENSATHNLRLFNKDAVLYKFNKLNLFINHFYPDLKYLLDVVYLNVYLDFFYKFTTLSKYDEREKDIEDIVKSIKKHLFPYCFSSSYVSVNKKIKAFCICFNYKFFLKVKNFVKKLRN